MTAGPLRIVVERDGLVLLFGTQRRVARVLDVEYAGVLAAAPSLANACQVVARELEQLAHGVNADAEGLRWCASVLRDSLPKGGG